jgi:hypothetical protein
MQREPAHVNLDDPGVQAMLAAISEQLQAEGGFNSVQSRAIAKAITIAVASETLFLMQRHRQDHECQENDLPAQP